MTIDLAKLEAFNTYLIDRYTARDPVVAHYVGGQALGEVFDLENTDFERYWAGNDPGIYVPEGIFPVARITWPESEHHLENTELVLGYQPNERTEEERLFLAAFNATDVGALAAQASFDITYPTEVASRRNAVRDMLKRLFVPKMTRKVAHNDY